MSNLYCKNFGKRKTISIEYNIGYNMGIKEAINVILIELGRHLLPNDVKMISDKLKDLKP